MRIVSFIAGLGLFVVGLILLAAGWYAADDVSTSYPNTSIGTEQCSPPTESRPYQECRWNGYAPEQVTAQAIYNESGSAGDRTTALTISVAGAAVLLAGAVLMVPISLRTGAAPTHAGTASYQQAPPAHPGQA